jgi:hypothetical protein
MALQRFKPSQSAIRAGALGIKMLDVLAYVRMVSIRHQGGSARHPDEVYLRRVAAGSQSAIRAGALGILPGLKRLATRQFCRRFPRDCQVGGADRKISLQNGPTNPKMGKFYHSFMALSKHLFGTIREP